MILIHNMRLLSSISSTKTDLHLQTINFNKKNLKFRMKAQSFRMFKLISAQNISITNRINKYIM